tara:strand:+ start:2789 stop:4642 length:1854 start_codon:yes stop_codon:yes gene_type:complete
MKKLNLIILLNIGIILSTLAQFEPFQNDESYSVFMNLNKILDDKLKVEMVPPIIRKDSVEFHMAKIIPGTYDIENYGRFISDFKALDSRGNELKIRKLDLNRWMIYGAKDLYKITYWADDTFDSETPSGIFEPAGTSISKDVVLLNNFGFIGYLDGFKDQPYTLNIAKPKEFYASTALQGELMDTLDVFKVNNYFMVHDNPILYCVPDTATRMVGGAEVIVSVYSPSKKVNAQTALDKVADVLDAAAVYLGGNLPVEKYAVLVYCVGMQDAGSGYGALEHHTSTVLYMPEFGGNQFYNSVKDITSHEFFHIVTPLNIHSEHIANFDFINPTMSQHIWLYEGVTEYNSHLVQVRNGIYDMDKFLEVMKSKMLSNDGFNEDIPLTKASEFTLSFFKDQYFNFYQKGALAGMALDLELRKHSNSEYGLVDLLQELGATYGADTFFLDTELFDLITEMTYPEMREFFARHFEGAEPFDLKSLLASAGINYDAEKEVPRIISGNVGYGYNFTTSRVRVDDISKMDAFGHALGLKEGDEIIQFHGKEVSLKNISKVIGELYKTAQEGDNIEVLIARKDKKGRFKEKTLKAKAQMGTSTKKHVIEIIENPSLEQLQMRKAWINQ